MIITCSPDSLVSWNYFLEGGGHQAIWQKKWTSEQGAILIDDVYFAIKKHGVASGKWTIERDEEVVYTGKKLSAFRRSFVIEGSGHVYDLGPMSLLGRSMFFAKDGNVLALISPKHWYSKKATIEILDPDTDFPALVFAFWLTVLLWRRRARNS